MIRYIKSLIPISLKLKIRHFLWGKNLELVKTDNKKRIYFFLAAGCNNLGDVAITLAIEKFAENYFSDYTLIQIPLYETLSYINTVKKDIRPHDLIFLVGGGNMGDLYEDIEFYRQHVIKSFHKNPIVSFPQSIYFKSSNKKRKAATIYNLHPNLTIMARDEKSYNTMTHLLHKCDVLLMPDIVMTLNKSQDIERNGVVLCMRKDLEKSDNDHKLAHFLKINNISNPLCIDNIVRDRVRLSDKEITIEHYLETFQKASLILTDRLHGMIFGYITATPTLFLENSTGKLGACYQWISKCGYIFPLSSKDTIINSANTLYQLQESQKIILKRYEELASILRKKIEP